MAYDYVTLRDRVNTSQEIPWSFLLVLTRMRENYVVRNDALGSINLATFDVKYGF